MVANLVKIDMAIIKRVYVEKKRDFSVAADHLLQDLKSHLSLTGLTGVRVIIRYDVEDISDDVYTSALTTVFSEPPVDNFLQGNSRPCRVQKFCSGISSGTV